jgi:hypothetical protein
VFYVEKNDCALPVRCVLVFTVFCIVCTMFLYCFAYVYLFLFVLSVLVLELLPPSENSIAVNKNRGADKSLAPPGRKQATATEDFDVHVSYL